MDNTKVQLENQCESIKKELEAIADGEAWRLSDDDSDNFYSAEAIIIEVINKGKKEFVEAIESLLESPIDYSDEDAVQAVINNVLSKDESDFYEEDICEALEDAGLIEKFTMYDYFSDNYRVEYVVGGDKDFRGVEITVACGGPAIHINSDGTIKGRWWGTNVDTYMSKSAEDAVYDWGNEAWDCIK